MDDASGGCEADDLHREARAEFCRPGSGRCLFATDPENNCVFFHSVNKILLKRLDEPPGLPGRAFAEDSV